MVDDFAALNRKVAAIQRDLSGNTSRQQMARVGRELAPEIERAVRGDIGDTSLSGWRRRGPIQIVGRSRALSDHAVIVEPTGAGKPVMKVLSDGRHANGGVGAVQGPRAPGKRRARRARRWNGRTQGKGTMADASEAIKRRAPALVEREVVKVLGRHLTRG